MPSRLQHEMWADVRCGSLADLAACLAMSAFPPKADIPARLRAPILFFIRQPRAHPGWYPSHKSEKEPVLLEVPWHASRLGAEIKQRGCHSEADRGTDENTPLITRQQVVNARDDEERKNTGHVTDQEGDKEKRQSPVKPRPSQKLGKQHGDEDEPAQKRPQENEER